MEAFSLLKYWRGTGGGSAVFSSGANPHTSGSTTVITTVSPHPSDSDESDGPFFDLEFTTNNIDDEEAKIEERCKISSKNEDEEEVEESELKFTLSSSSSSSVDGDGDDDGDGLDQNAALSPSDDLFFKGSLVPIEPSSLLLTEANSKFTSSLLKSATKFRVLMLKLKKQKPNALPHKIEKSESNSNGKGFVSAPQNKKISEEETLNRTQKKLLTVKFDEVSVMSLFTRDNSSNNGSTKTNATHAAVSDEKKLSKDLMHKYLKKVKPLYIRVSKRYGEKLRFSGQLNAAEKAEAVNVQGNIPTGLRIVRKHLGKSRSASSTAVVAAAPAVVSNRRDDSLLQQQDAIQGAILHCKRSFNSSRDSESSILSRSASDGLLEKSTSLMEGGGQSGEKLGVN